MSKGNGKGLAKTPTKTPGTGHGNNGNLRAGNPGNKGGGREASKVREAARFQYAERLHVLTTIADDEDNKPLERIAALKLLADSGGVDKIALTVDEQPEQELTPERVANFFEQIQRIKTVQQLEKLMVGAAKKQMRGGE